MIAIEKASLAHLLELTPLFEAYREFYRQPPDYPAAEVFLQQRLEKQESTIFIAAFEGVHCGFTQLYPLFSSTKLARLFLLNDLYVTPTYRNKGIGKALITVAQEYTIAQQASGLLLETEKNNAPGNHLYPLMGFEKDNAHHYYFWDAPTS